MDTKISEGRTTMKLSSAELLLKGKHEIRAINDPCDPSCFVWFACANSKPNGICKGFVLLDGESRKLINKNLTDDDEVYVSNCMRMIQDECSEETEKVLVPEVLRFLSPETEYPETCTASCIHRTCPYYRVENFGQPCKHRTPTNEELKEPKLVVRSAEKFLESIPRNSKFGELVDRLDRLEQKISEVEKHPELSPLIPKKPNFFKPKNPNGEDQE